MTITCTKDYILTVNSALTVQAYWTMSESGSAADRVDSAALVHLTPTFPGSITSDTGKVGNGLAFIENGTTSFDNIGGQPTLRLQSATGWSMFGWLKVLNWGNAWAQDPLMDWYQVGSPERVFLQLDSFAAHQLDVTVRDDNNTTFTPAPFSPTLGTWYFIHVFFDGSNVGYSINNGAPVMDLTPGAVFATTANGNLQFRCSWGGSVTNTVDFVMDEIGFKTNAKLTPTEVAFLYNSGSGRTWPL